MIPEWSEKNKNISPEAITYKNRTNVWWHCSKCGNDYQAVVYARVQGRICPFCVANVIRRLREQRLANRLISKDFEYLLPQLATIYYAGKHRLKVITDSDDPVGIPITAYVPEISLAIDVCCGKNLVAIKEYICSTKGITYVSIPGKIPEADVLNTVRQALLNAHIYTNTSIIEDLEILRKRFAQWKQRKDL